MDYKDYCAQEARMIEQEISQGDERGDDPLDHQGMMSKTEAMCLVPGNRVVVTVDAMGDTDEGEQHVPAGDVWLVDFVNTFPPPQGYAVTVSHRSGVVNVFDEADFNGTYPFKRTDDDADMFVEVESSRRPSFYTVSIHLVDRAYGGPEEGGWWYDHGEPVSEIPAGINPHDLVTVFTDEAVAIAWANTLQLQLDVGPNKQRRSDIGSVLSEGQYRAEVQDGWPRAWPETRPHYE